MPMRTWIYPTLRWTVWMIVVLGWSGPTPMLHGQERVLIFDARADQTGSTNGGAAIWSFDSNKWRWWFQNVSEANVSPDGTRVLYVFNNNVFLSDVRGRNPRLFRARSRVPAWSPRGDLVALLDLEGDLLVLTAEGAVVKTFPDIYRFMPYPRPTWSPDQTEIGITGTAYADEIGCEFFDQQYEPCPRKSPIGSVFALNIWTGSQRQLFDPSHISVEVGKFKGGPNNNTTYTSYATTKTSFVAPVWSPDGTQIAANYGVIRWHTYPMPGTGITTGWKYVEFNTALIPSSGGLATHVTHHLNPSPFLDATLRTSWPSTWDDEGRLYLTQTRNSTDPASLQGTFVREPDGSIRPVNGFVANNIQYAVLNTSGVAIQITTPSLKYASGKRFEATIKLSLRETTARTVEFKDVVLRAEQTNVLRVSSIPLPGTVLLTPGAPERTFTIPVEAGEQGESRLVSSILVKDGAGQVSTVTARQSVKVTVLGDLWIKTAAESRPAFGADDVYQKTPSGRQSRTNIVGAAGISEFDVRVQNDTLSPQSYRIASTETGSNDWVVVYFLDVKNITAEIKSPAGYLLPPLAPGKFHSIVVAMAQTNVDQQSYFRSRLALSSEKEPGEILDTVQANSISAAKLVVNSEADLPDKDPTDCCCDTGRKLADGTQECTLRAAIQVANHLEGVKAIQFAIKDANDNRLDPAIIAPKTPLPPLTSQTIIEGFTQKDKANRNPSVVLSGENISPAPVGQHQTASGLVVEAGGCVIAGLVIQWFPSYGMELHGDGGAVVRCYIGTDVTGMLSRANGITSDDWENFTKGGGILVTGAGNQIGGIDAGNLIAGTDNGARIVDTVTAAESEVDPDVTLYSGTALILAEGADETIVQGNYIGVAANGMDSTSDSGGLMMMGIFVQSDGNWIGDSAENPKGMNIVCNSLVGMAVLGQDNRVLGNQIGVGFDGGNLGNEVGISVGGLGNQIGAEGAGNLLMFNGYGITCRDAQELTIEGNSIGDTEKYQLSPGNRNQYVGIVVNSGSDGALIRRNLISNHLFEGIRVGGDGRPVDGLDIVDNEVSWNGRAGQPVSRMTAVHIVSGRGNAISRNALIDNTGFAISLRGVGNEDGSLSATNDEGDWDDGPNTLLNFPTLEAAVLSGSDLALTGELSATVDPVEMRIEIYVGRTGTSNPENFFGSVEVPTSPDRPTPFVARHTGDLSAGQYISTIAIDPDGNTSEVSPSVMVQGPTDEEQDGASDDVENQVPSPSSPTPAPLTLQVALADVTIAKGDGNGDGRLDSQQSNVVSLPSLSGDWITLSAKDGVAFREVLPQRLPYSGQLPSGYSFPIGALQFGVRGLSPGTDVVLTNRFHSPVSCSTVFAFGPTSTDPQPHWYELPSGSVSISGGEVTQFRVTLRDRGTGDHDLKVDGAILTLLAPAYRLPPPPRLELLGSRVDPVSRLTIAPGPPGAPTLETNTVPLVSLALGWPDAGSNYVLESTDSLSNTNLWRPVRQLPVLQNQRWVLTNSSLDRVRHYRLRKQN